MSGRSDQFKIGIIIKKMLANFFFGIDKLPIYMKYCLLNRMNQGAMSRCFLVGAMP